MESWKDAESVLQHHGLPYVPEIIWTKFISYYNNDPFTSHFVIYKTRKLIARIFYWPILYKDITVYIHECNVYLASKTIKYKSYHESQSWSVQTNNWKNLSMDFVTWFSLSTNEKRDSYNAILVIVDKFTKMIHYELVKTTIDIVGLVKIIINMIVRHHNLFKSIVKNQGSLIICKF